MEYEIYKSDELAHHGIKGMKWGVRRYQRKDGSLTPAGKRRIQKETEALKKEAAILKNRKSTQAKFDRLEAKRKSLDEQKKALDADNAKNKTAESKAAKNSVKKSPKEMTDEELAKAISRARMEDEYRRLRPEPVNEKHPLMKKMVNEVVVPAAINSGRKFLEGAINKATSDLLKDKIDPNSLEGLKKTYEKLDYKQKIDKIMNPDKYLSEEDKTKRQDRAFKAEDREARKEGYADAADKSVKTRAAEEAARKAAADEAARVANEAKSREYYNSVYNMRNVESTRVRPSEERGLAVVNNMASNNTTSMTTRSNVTNGESVLDFILEDRGGNPIRSYTSDDDVTYRR